MSIHGRLPTEPWSPENLAAENPKTKSEKEKLSMISAQRQTAMTEIKRFLKISEVALQKGGEVSFESPKFHSVWTLPIVINFVHRHQLYTTIAEGRRFAVSSHRMVVGISNHEQHRLHRQKLLETQALVLPGSSLEAPERYSVPLCRCLLSSLFGFESHAAAMPCEAAPAEEHGHREKEVQPESWVQ